MARKSKNLDEKLIKTGKKLLEREGIEGFSLRELARKSGVNLGMITYYFRSKEGYLKTLLMSVYAPFIQDLLAALQKKGRSPEENLEIQLFWIAKFSRDHSKLILPLLAGVAQGNSVIIQFLKKDFTLHFKIIEESVRIFLKEFEVDERLLPELMQFLLSSVALSNFLGEVKGRLTSKKYSVSDEELQARVSAAIHGVKFFLESNKVLSKAF